MTTPERAGGSKAGFTLLELLLAVFIFSVIATIVFSSFQSTFTTVNTAEETATLDTQARLIFERIESDILSIRLEQQDCFMGETRSINGGRGDTLEFCSGALVRLHREPVPSGVKVVTYSVKEDEESGLLDLYRLEREYGENETDASDSDAANAGVRIGKGIREFRVDYLDAGGDELENWERAEDTVGQENGGETAPRVVKILISFGAEDGGFSHLYRSGFAVW